MQKTTCFKAYDIRGKVPEELNEELAWRIGRAYAQWLKPRTVAIGRDVRLSGSAIQAAVSRGLREEGVTVHNIGVCGTEEIYFATAHFQLDGGIMVTASHNPAEYNGMKLVRAQSRPISGDTGLGDIRKLVETEDFAPQPLRGEERQLAHRAEYIRHLLTFVDKAALKPLKIVVNAGNGCAGPVLDLLAEHLPFEFIRLQHQPDGHFPTGVPNPLLPDKRDLTAKAVRYHHADLGLAWDGDFDRCFFFDETGAFIEGYYLVGLLAEMFLTRHPGATIIHDPRLIWNTQVLVAAAGGKTVESKSGHAFIKERMRNEDAVYGGEMSAHHYFRDFFYCDSGMIPWLIVVSALCHRHQPLSALVNERVAKFPVSGEINRRSANPQAALKAVEAAFPGGMRDETDGLSLAFDDWRFNLRLSNTEPVIRLNVETRGNTQLLKEKTEQILKMLE